MYVGDISAAKMLPACAKKKMSKKKIIFFGRGGGGGGGLRATTKTIGKWHIFTYLSPLLFNIFTSFSILHINLLFRAADADMCLDETKRLFMPF